MTARYTAIAEGFLDEAAEGGTELRDLVVQHLAAMRGIGYALLEIGERAGALADASDDRNLRLEELAEHLEFIAGSSQDLVTADRPAGGRDAPRWWQLRRRRTAACLDQRLQEAADTISDARLAEPGGLYLEPGEADMVLQALEDAAAWRTGRAWEAAAAGTGWCPDCRKARDAVREAGGPDAADWARCPLHAQDERRSVEYTGLRAGLAGGRARWRSVAGGEPR